jgi:hypothetical protein
MNGMIIIKKNNNKQTKKNSFNEVKKTVKSLQNLPLKKPTNSSALPMKKRKQNRE